MEYIVNSPEWHFKEILKAIGENADREGLVETPKRYIKLLKEMTNNNDFIFTAFENEGIDEMIVQKNIPFYSLCEHHTAPFFGIANVAYIPGDKIVGLSKLARTVEYYAKGLQNQERITTNVANRLMKELHPIGVAVQLRAQHLCMAMRGVRAHNVETVTTKLLGVLKSDVAARNEFLAACNM